MISYYNYPSYNSKSYEVVYPAYSANNLKTYYYTNKFGRRSSKVYEFDNNYFMKHYKSYRYDPRVYNFEKYLTDSELNELDSLMYSDAFYKYAQGYKNIAIDDSDIVWRSRRTPPSGVDVEVRRYHDGRHKRKLYWFHKVKTYEDSELRNLYPEYREVLGDDIQALLSVASTREAKHRNIFSRPTYTNDDVMRYLFYTGSLDGKMFLRDNGDKLYINDPNIIHDLKVVQKVQKRLKMKDDIGNLVDFGVPSTSDILLDFPPLPNKFTGDVIKDLEYSRKLGSEAKNNVQSGRSEVIPANRTAERFYLKNPLIFQLVNKMHGNTDVLV